MRVLITCFSSISNVAAIVPQLYGLTCDYPEHEFVVLSRGFLRPLFDKLNNVTFVGGDIRGAHKTPIGVFRLFKELKALRPDVVLDMQRSWRTKMIARLFMLSGTKTLTIGFASGEQKKLIKKGLIELFPKNIDTMVELFGGSSAVSMNTRANSYIISDITIINN